MRFIQLAMITDEYHRKLFGGVEIKSLARILDASVCRRPLPNKSKQSLKHEYTASRRLRIDQRRLY